MPDILAQWFANYGSMPQGHANLSTPGLAWIYLIANVTLGIAYYAIPLALLYLACRRPRLRFTWVFVLFSVFIFACGTSHFVSAWTLWHSDHWLDAGVRLLAALVSIVSAALLWWHVPAILQVPNVAKLRKVVDQLEHEITERTQVEEALRESRETLRELAAYQERIREDERKRIARELHDELGQNLLALRLDVSMLHARAGDRHPLLRKRTELALDYIDTTMKSIRAIMNNLRPSVLDLGLQAAIEWQVRQFEHRNGIPCELLMSEQGLEVGDAQATAIFRILQESLTNVGRHAQATSVRVALRVEGKLLTMTIADNGVGMYPDDRRKARRFGLIGIQERASMLGGELHIESAPGQGTVLHLSLPLQNDAHEKLAASA